MMALKPLSMEAIYGARKDMPTRHQMPHCGSNWMPKGGHTRGKQVHKCGDCKGKYTADAEQPHYPEHTNRQAVKMRVEGARVSAARVVGASAPSVSGWVKRGALARERMRAMSAWRASGSMAAIAASTIALDEMWTYVGARRKEKRNGIWVWTAAAVERDGSGWIDFEVGGRDEATFMRLLERLPDAERYEPDAYGVYGCLPVNKHAVGKCEAVNRNEALRSMLRGKLNGLARCTVAQRATRRAWRCGESAALVFCDKIKLNTENTFATPGLTTPIRL